MLQAKLFCLTRNLYALRERITEDVMKKERVSIAKVPLNLTAFFSK